MPFFDLKPQHVSKRLAFARGFVLALCLLGVAACGKKPPEVDPPLGGEKGIYPRVYPDPRTDPAL